MRPHRLTYRHGWAQCVHQPIRATRSRNADIAELSDETLINICERLNETPRKYLGYRTPAEVLMNALDPGLPELRNPDQRSPGSPWVRGYP